MSEALKGYYMELYKVVVEYADWQAEKRWENSLKKTYDDILDIPSRPDPKRVTVYSAVYGSWGSGQVLAASEIALRNVVGLPDAWRRVRAWTPLIEHLGLVFVEAREKQ